MNELEAYHIYTNCKTENINLLNDQSQFQSNIMFNLLDENQPDKINRVKQLDKVDSATNFTK